MEMLGLRLLFSPITTALAMTERLQADCEVSEAHPSHDGDHTTEDILPLTRLTFRALLNLVRHVENKAPEVPLQIHQRL